MTDQSRVEAVARALDPGLWQEYDRLRAEKATLHELFVIDIQLSKERAETAIEANDAWLRAHLKDLAGALGYRLGNSFGAIGDYEPETVASAAINEIVALGNQPTQEDTDK